MDNIPIGYNNEGNWIGSKDERVIAAGEELQRNIQLGNDSNIVYLGEMDGEPVWRRKTARERFQEILNTYTKPYPINIIVNGDETVYKVNLKKA